MSQPVRVLVVDDHQMVIDGIKLMLQKKDSFQFVGQANNGVQALAFLEKEFVDVILLDLHMPELNGLETCKKIKKAFKDVKVIMLTMSEDTGLIKQLIKIGVEGYLLKSANEEVLYEAIQKVVNKEKYFSTGVQNLLMEEVFAPGQQKKKPNFPRLSKREKQILALIMDELTTAEIADQLFISSGTVETHRRNMLAKLNARNMAGLVRIAMEYNLLNN